MEVKVLYLGRMECKRDYLVKCDDKEAMIKSPVSAILLKHPELGNILYDTGNSPFYNSAYPEHVLETYPIVEFISVEEAILKEGITPDDIDMIIMSHLHFDHAGGLKYFSKSKAIKNVVVAEPELKNAYYKVTTGNSGAYVKEMFDIDGICYKPYRNELRLANDITVFSQESHTPGCTGLILRLKGKGTVIVTSDTIYTRDNYDYELPPGGNINATAEEFYSNLSRIKAMCQEYEADIIFGHDYEQIQELAKKSII